MRRPCSLERRIHLGFHNGAGPLGTESSRLAEAVEPNPLGRIDDDRGVEVAFEPHLEQQRNFRYADRLLAGYALAHPPVPEDPDTGVNDRLQPVSSLLVLENDRRKRASIQ